MTDRIRRARDLAFEDARQPVSAPPEGRARPVRVAVGDPQAPLETFLAVLDRHGLLGAGGRLRPEVELYSMGDHFDWGGAAQRQRAADEALALLAWLAAHPSDQVRLVLGNHDLARVGELAGFDDARLARALPEAQAAYASEDEALERRFLEHYPDVPSAECVARDFAAFRGEQRALVELLLRARRFRIAFAPAPDLLLCHAGVTADDLAGVGWAPGADAAAALNAALDRAVDAWRGGRLDLGPLHRPGDAAYGEGRGIFFHRPSDPAHEEAHYFEGPPRRRFDPRRLPAGLVQAIGHIRDKKCRVLLAAWTDGAEAQDGPLRSLVVEGGAARYGFGVEGRAGPGRAVMVFTDGGMAHAPVERYELLDLDRRAPLRPLG